MHSLQFFSVIGFLNKCLKFYNFYILLSAQIAALIKTEDKTNYIVCLLEKKLIVGENINFNIFK